MSDSNYVLRPNREPGLDLWGLIHFEGLPDHKVAWFAKAYHWSRVLHASVLRKSGESFHRHDARCAKMAAAGGLPIEMPTIMLAHEFEEDDGLPTSRIRRHCGRDVAVSVHALSKESKEMFPDPDGRRKRLLSNIDRMKKATEAGPILDGLYDCNWFVPMGRGLDRGDNSVDTAAIPAWAQERFFAETDRDVLPFLYWGLDFIPRLYVPQYRMLLVEIENNCDNYWRAKALRTA